MDFPEEPDHDDSEPELEPNLEVEESDEDIEDADPEYEENNDADEDLVEPDETHETNITFKDIIHSEDAWTETPPINIENSFTFEPEPVPQVTFKTEEEAFDAIFGPSIIQKYI
uniref:Uncharacterized protein n=1 Tax=Acrobeloides nanus TaxID=290746 RepID=A0A914DHP0_9BILA